jgi:hypothetical protein
MWKFPPDRWKFFHKYYSVSCFFTLCRTQKGCFAARAFNLRIVLSSGGAGCVSSLITAGLGRGLAVSVDSGIMAGQVFGEFTFI